jgi:hypothetical protein
MHPPLQYIHPVATARANTRTSLSSAQPDETDDAAQSQPLKYPAGGVEEAKEEYEFSPSSANLRQRDSHDANNTSDEDEKGFPAMLEDMGKFFLGSCGNALEQASLSCRWPGAGAGAGNDAVQDGGKRDIVAQPLSIAEELRKLAAFEGPVFQPRAADIPRFLGEDAVYSFDDDNVSAISQHTLEDMARKGYVHPMCKPHESPGRTRSSSSSSKNGREGHVLLRHV